MPKLGYELTPLPLAAVDIQDSFWSPRLKINRTRSLFHQYRMLKDSGRLDALRLIWKSGDPNPPHIFWESDTAKWLEAASNSLATHPDAQLQALVDEVIARLAVAQQNDGYLNAHYTCVEPDKRLTNLRDGHELYCAGHLIEAGVAHFHATGLRSLLNIVCRYADYLCSVFGPGKRIGYPGHEEVELALVKLHGTTSQRRYLDLAQFFIDQRGRQPNFFEEEAKARGETAPPRFDAAYFQAHIPVRRQREAVGHAVRAMYLYSAMADLAATTGEASLLAACRTLWDNVTQCKMYITGGIGSRHEGEAFGDNFELPNLTAYCETCAAIGLVFFAHRMLQIEPHRRYADVLERSLYNGVLSSVSRDGRKYFYVNPLASLGKHRRQEWYACACCPPNLARLLASLGQYIYSIAPDAIYVHQFIGGSARFNVDGNTILLVQETRYPDEGDVRITLRVQTPARFGLHIRIPGWCRGHAMTVNGKRLAAPVKNGYAQLVRTWGDGDRLDLDLSMPVERVAADPRVMDNAGRIALQRGPLVYCLEQCDHAADINSLAIPDTGRIRARVDAKRLEGAVVLEGPALEQSSTSLYAPTCQARHAKPARFSAIPYYLWGNRKPGAMKVWLPRV